MRKNIFLIIVFLFMGCFQDMAYEKNIFKKYYLIAVDDRKDMSISLKLENGDFIGRISNISEYAVDTRDSLLFARVSNHLNKSKYFVLNTVKDYDHAKVEDVVIGPLDSVSFINNWAKGKKIKFISPLN